MAHKTLVGGTAYDVTGGRALAGGTGYDIKGGRTLVAGTGYDVAFGRTLDATFANNSWEDIIWACQNHAVPATWAVGDQKTMILGNDNYAIDIIGKNHDVYSAGGGTAPLTLQMNQSFVITKRMDTSANGNTHGWKDCQMRITHLPWLISVYMPPEVQTALREVNKTTSAGDKSTTIETTADKMFLLSEVEVFGTTSKSPSGEGTRYAYYANGGKTSKTMYGNGNYKWWLRTPDITNSTKYCAVSLGSLNSYDNVNERGIAAAFCF